MILTDKRQIRRNVRAEIAILSTDEKSTLSAQICSTLLHSQEVGDASVVALFISLTDEPETGEIIAELAKTKRVVVPRIEGEEMEFYDIAEGVSEGAFGILEPLSTTPVEPSEIDVMVVPGVAFTQGGERLGRGKGFYDKYLSRKGFRAHTIGICYPCQVVEHLPVEPHDKVLDKVVWG